MYENPNQYAVATAREPEMTQRVLYLEESVRELRSLLFSAIEAAGLRILHNQPIEVVTADVARAIENVRYGQKSGPVEAEAER